MVMQRRGRRCEWLMAVVWAGAPTREEGRWNYLNAAAKMVASGVSRQGRVGEVAVMERYEAKRETGNGKRETGSGKRETWRRGVKWLGYGRQRRASKDKAKRF